MQERSCIPAGRSRNDQVALDMKLYTRSEITALQGLVVDMLRELLAIMKDNTETIMPGFTHLQKAQPITLAHHMGAYFEMFKRDHMRLKDIYKRMNTCPLGSGALAGTTYDLDRAYTAELLGFDGPTLNSMDSVSDRDYLIELMSALSTIMMHLSRFSEEVIIWNSNEYQFVDIDDSYSTGSSIMPQKKNPDIAELVRGKTGRVYGALTSILTTMKGIPLAYNKDMQEDKELVFDAIDTISGQENVNEMETEIGSMIYAVKPGDGSAREQAASCQRVIGGLANITKEYATKRYRSNVMNWGMIPFQMVEEPEFEVGDYIYVPGAKAALDGDLKDIKAYVINADTKAVKEISLYVADMTADERKIVKAGCLINYNRARKGLK